MAISKIGGGASDNWELISSVTPTAGSAAVNFTGLSPYKKFLVKGKAGERYISVTDIGRIIKQLKYIPIRNTLCR